MQVTRREEHGTENTGTFVPLPECLGYPLMQDSKYTDKKAKKLRRDRDNCE
jgi:hypothetical protein